MHGYLLKKNRVSNKIKDIKLYCAEDVDSICDRNPTVRTNFNVNASYNGSNILNDQCEANMPPNTPFPQNRYNKHNVRPHSSIQLQRILPTAYFILSFIQIC
jgi:hypothetical protein